AREELTVGGGHTGGGDGGQPGEVVEGGLRLGAGEGQVVARRRETAQLGEQRQPDRRSREVGVDPVLGDVLRGEALLRRRTPGAVPGEGTDGLSQGVRRGRGRGVVGGGVLAGGVRVPGQ